MSLLFDLLASTCTKLMVAIHFFSTPSARLPKVEMYMDTVQVAREYYYTRYEYGNSHARTYKTFEDYLTVENTRAIADQMKSKA